LFWSLSKSKRGVVDKIPVSSSNPSWLYIWRSGSGLWSSGIYSVLIIMKTLVSSARFGEEKGRRKQEVEVRGRREHENGRSQGHRI
jgi:hypothetical protein